MAQKIGAEGAESCETIVKFSSKRKKASIVVKRPGGYRVYSKGAPDFLFEHCTHVVGANGQVEDFKGKTTVPEELKLKGALTPK